jgi:hypothetical protein
MPAALGADCFTSNVKRLLRRRQGHEPALNGWHMAGYPQQSPSPASVAQKSVGSEQSALTQ